MYCIEINTFLKQLQFNLLSELYVHHTGTYHLCIQYVYVTIGWKVVYNLIVQDVFLAQYYILITRIYMHNINVCESECDTFEPLTVKTVKSPVKWDWLLEMY